MAWSLSRWRRSYQYAFNKLDMIFIHELQGDVEEESDRRRQGNRGTLGREAQASRQPPGVPADPVRSDTGHAGQLGGRDRAVAGVVQGHGARDSLALGQGGRSDLRCARSGRQAPPALDARAGAGIARSIRTAGAGRGHADGHRDTAGLPRAFRQGGRSLDDLPATGSTRLAQGRAAPPTSQGRPGGPVRL